MPSQATGVAVTDTLPGGVTFKSATSSQGSCTFSSDVVCTVGTMKKAARVSVTLVVTTTQAGTITNTATVAADQSDPDSSDNQTTTTTTVEAPLPPVEIDLSVDVTDSPDPYIDAHDILDDSYDGITYRIVITNESSTSTATDVTLDVTWNSLTPGRITADQGSCERLDGPSARCSLGTLAPGATATVEFNMGICPLGGGESLNAVVSSAAPDPDPSNNSDEESTTVVDGNTFCTA